MVDKKNPNHVNEEFGQLGLGYLNICSSAMSRCSIPVSCRLAQCSPVEGFIYDVAVQFDHLGLHFCKALRLFFSRDQFPEWRPNEDCAGGS